MSLTIVYTIAVDSIATTLLTISGSRTTVAAYFYPTYCPSVCITIVTALPLKGSPGSYESRSLLFDVTMTRNDSLVLGELQRPP